MISGRRDGGQGVERPKVLPEQEAVTSATAGTGQSGQGQNSHIQPTASLGPLLLGAVA